MNDDPRPACDAARTAAALASTDDLLARYKHASLARQALRAAWDLGALARRAEREAPEVLRPLRDAMAVLLVLGEQPGDRGARETLPASASPFRQGELF